MAGSDGHTGLVALIPNGFPEDAPTYRIVHVALGIAALCQSFVSAANHECCLLEMRLVRALVNARNLGSNHADLAGPETLRST